MTSSAARLGYKAQQCAISKAVLSDFILMQAYFWPSRKNQGEITIHLTSKPNLLAYYFGKVLFSVDKNLHATCKKRSLAKREPCLKRFEFYFFLRVFFAVLKSMEKVFRIPIKFWLLLQWCPIKMRIFH